MPWGDPGVAELQMVLENANVIPSAAGGNQTTVFQRAGFLRKLRCNLYYEVDQSAATGAPSKSAKGPLGSTINNITLQANGMTPLIQVSGVMAMMYNETQHYAGASDGDSDSSALCYASYVADSNISAATLLEVYTAAGTGAQTYIIKYPFEFEMAIPLVLRGQPVEWGLWLLQNQTVDLTWTIGWNIGYAASATPDSPYSGGTGVTAPVNTGTTQLTTERELYTVPAPAGQDGKANYPDINWAHQIIEYTQPIVSNFARFDVPKAGLLLKALVYAENSSGAPQDISDIKSLNWIYGANANPINRSGLMYINDYLYARGYYPPAGLAVLDFYAKGWFGLKLARDTQSLANLRLEATFATLSTGKLRIVLDRMVPISRMVG